MKSRLGEREISNAKIRLDVRGLHIRISILRLPGSSTSARIGDSNGGMLARSWVADYFAIVLSSSTGRIPVPDRETSIGCIGLWYATRGSR